jgi:cysteinyl-tRNA synthetase
VVFPGVDDAERRLDQIYSALARARELAQSDAAPSAKLPADLLTYKKAVEAAEAECARAIDDDLNTPVALASLGELARLANELGDACQKRRKDASFVNAAAGVAGLIERALLRSSALLGLLQAEPSLYRQRTQARRLRVRGLSEIELNAKVEARATARRNKDFAAGDRIRDELLELGVSLRDAPSGTEWTLSQ